MDLLFASPRLSKTVRSSESQLWNNFNSLGLQYGEQEVGRAESLYIYRRIWKSERSQIFEDRSGEIVRRKNQKEDKKPFGHCLQMAHKVSAKCLLGGDFCGKC